MTTTESTEVAVQRPKPVNVPLGRPLDNMDQAWRLAQALAASDIVGRDLQNKPANAFLLMLYGQRLNLPPEIAIITIAVVKGKPRMSGQLLLAKVREAGHRPKIEHGNGQCTVTITRGDTGEEHSETFTLQDAVTAKLITLKDGKPYARSKQGEALPWENYPKRMLQWRAVGACVDVICPEVRMGFAVEDELDEPVTDRPTLAQVAAERVDVQPAEQPAEPEQSEEDEAAAMLAEINAIQQQHEASAGDGPLDVEVVDEDPSERESAAELWPEVKQPGGGQ